MKSAENFLLDKVTSDSKKAEDFLVSAKNALPKEQKMISQPADSSDLLFQGMTLGYGPKLTSAMTAAAGAPFSDKSFSELYKDIYGRKRRGIQEYEKQYPARAAGSEILGAIGSAGAAGALPLAKSAANIASKAGLFGKSVLGGLSGEASQRIYESGVAPIGEESAILANSTPSAGGVIGGAIPVVGGALGKIKQAFTPKISEARKEITNLAKKYDIPLGLDDLSDSKFYQYIISEGQNLPFSGAASNVENQLAKFTKAVARSIGLDDADNLTPVNMNEAFEVVGKKFDDLTKGKTFKLNDEAIDSLSSIEEGVASGTYGQQGPKLLNKYIDDLLIRSKDDTISGEQLSSLRNKFARISRTGTNPEAKALAKDFENVLIDLIGEDAPDALKKAKYQYKNLITVEPLARKAQVDGFISPAQLTGRVSQVYKRDFTKGKAGELGDLARLGQAIKTKVPQSGTAPRQMAQNLGITDLAAVGSGFVNPALPITYFGGKLGQVGLNRLLQARNVNPVLLERAINPVAQRSVSPITTGFATGAGLGTLQQ